MFSSYPILGAQKLDNHMNKLLETLSILPSIYRGNFVDIDEEHNRAYKKYPFPWPHDKQYESYTREDVEKTLSLREQAFESFLEEFDLNWKYFENKSVADLGTGVGWDALNMARHGAKIVYAIDNSDVSLQHGEKFSRLLDLKNIRFDRCSLYEIGRLELQADIIVVKGVLHNMFSLPKFVNALRRISKPETKILMSHSSYSTRLGFTHYLYNHLSWMMGGADLEKRIDAGIRLYRGYHWQLGNSLVRHRVNDMAGVFYMARGSVQIEKDFRSEGFNIFEVRWKPFTRLYHNLIKHHLEMVAVEKDYLWRRARRSVAIALVNTFYVLSRRFVLFDRPLGICYTFLFLMPPNLFVAEGGLHSDCHLSMK